MNRNAPVLDWLVAHRGWPARYPENSLEGMHAVLEAGARWVEFDVQLTADLFPVVIHDDSLSRLAGRPERVTSLNRQALAEVRTGTGDQAPAHIPLLSEMLALIGRYPGVTAFVEIKRQSLRRLGYRRTVERVLQEIQAAPCPTVLISFKSRALVLARKMGVEQIGWVFKPWTSLWYWRARQLQPDYLFVRADRIPDRSQPFWSGSWQWVVYGVDDLQTAQDLRQRGARLIEVDDLPGLVED